MTVCYATREDVLSSLDLAETTRAAGAQIDRLIGAASRYVEQLCHRRFYPERATKTFAWPDSQLGTSYRLWLDESEVLAVESIDSGGRAITDYFLEPQRYGPPYSAIEIDRATSLAWNANLTPQRAITVVGTWGACNDFAARTTLAAPMGATGNLLTVADPARLGIGSLLRIEDELVRVTDRIRGAAGVALLADVAERMSAQTLAVDADTIAIGETIRVDAETMRVLDTAPGTLYVQRAIDGTTLAAHTTATPLYVSRTFLVERGQLSTQAVTHGTAVSVAALVPPADVWSLVVQEVLHRLQNEQSGMLGTIGQGQRAGKVAVTAIADARALVQAAHGRLRKRAV